ncbi:WD40 repeat-like protein [Eremomyces bilateralis CBS 781.70]|uniref:WD40 repeat-like protein n=1 Tax=Eremomyces bilateralis CBS 781.70 TaxID=1392243 RepID=A0A6G1FXJ3_9PEZI|nr:WD40 repeat-like protein [Eremomyces bilateralis CBS 781.70]KAF1810400.1 WD40 repeat-like protein [Eremomyces bilateralis CBS 781.70]
MSNQCELPDAPSDAISAVRFSPSSTKLLVSSWDKHVYLYDVSKEAGDSPRLIQKFEHRAPVLDVCWGKDDSEAYSGGLDWDVRRIDLKSSEQTVLSSHSSAAKSLAFSASHNILVSASWDCTLHIHHIGTTTTPATIPLPHKPFSLSLSPTRLVVAMASRQLHIYDLPALSALSAQASQAPPNTLELEPWQRRESSLKFMTRAVACMPNDEGYASSSIEGRVAVEWFDPSVESQARKYAFKCHRQTVDGVDVVYPVNALSYHPVYGTFASGGGDGVVALWDGVAKRRIKQYQKYSASVVALAWNGDGTRLAVGVSPGFEDGKEVEEGVIKIYIREVAEGEAKGKGGK